MGGPTLLLFAEPGGQESEDAPDRNSCRATPQRQERIDVSPANPQGQMHRGAPVIHAGPAQGLAESQPLAGDHPCLRQIGKAHPHLRRWGDGHRLHSGHPSGEGDPSRHRRAHHRRRRGRQIHAPMTVPVGGVERAKYLSRHRGSQGQITGRNRPGRGGKRDHERREDDQPPPGCSQGESFHSYRMRGAQRIVKGHRRVLPRNAKSWIAV